MLIILTSARVERSEKLPDSSILASTQRSQINKEEEKKKESKQDEMADAKTPIQANTPMKSQSQETVDLTPVKPSKILENLTKRKESERLLRKRTSVPNRSKKISKTKSTREKSIKDSEKGGKDSLKEIITFMMPQDPPRPPRPKMTEPWTWLKVSEIIVLFYLMLDSFELFTIMAYALRSGGFFFLAAHFILSFLFEFPLLNLFVHIGQYTGTGITKVFGLYTVIFRGLGWSVLLISVLLSSIAVQNSGHRLSRIYHAGLNSNKLIDCREHPEYDCGVNGNFTFDDEPFCCTSILHVTNCVSDPRDNLQKANVASLGSVCVQSIPAKVQLITALRLFEGRYSVEVGAGLLISVAVGVVFGLLASTGYKFYTFAVAIIGALTILLYLVYLIGFIFFGNMGNGIWALYAATEIENFITIQTCQYLLALTVIPLMKFGVISFSSFRSTTFDSFYTVLPISIVRKVLLLGGVLANIGLLGYFVSYPKQESSYDIHGRATEFLLSSSLPPFFFYVSRTAVSTLEFSTVAGLMYIALGIHRDHLSQAASYWKYLLIAGFLAVLAVFVAIFHFAGTQPTVPTIIFEFIPPIGAFWFCVIGQCTVFVYGQLEHLLDRAPAIPSRGKWTNSVGAASPIYPRWVAIGFTQILVGVYAADGLIKLLKLRKSGQLVPLFTGYAVMLLPILVFIVFTAIFLFRINKYSIYYGRENIWRLVYPSPEHPSYSRILKNDEIQRKMDGIDSSGRSKSISAKVSRGGFGYQAVVQT